MTSSEQNDKPVAREVKFQFLYKGIPFSASNKAFNWHKKTYTLEQLMDKRLSDLCDIHDTSELVAKRQYINKKDIRGNDICEGDIVKWDDGSNGKYWRVAVVELSPALQFRCFDCPAIENSSCHGHIFKFGNFIYTDTHNHLEIIGNIYQSLELLQEPKL